MFTARPAGGYKWDLFIKNLRLVREDGSVVPLQPAGRNRWSLHRNDRPIELNYETDLSFTDTGKVEAGSQRGGQFFGDALYVVNRALFVIASAVSARSNFFPGRSDLKFCRDFEFDFPRSRGVTNQQPTGRQHHRAWTIPVIPNQRRQL